MSFFNFRKRPGVAWPVVPRGAMSHLWGLYRRLDDTQWLAPADVVAGQLAQARDLLAHCRLHVPYYEEQLGGAGVEPTRIGGMDDFRHVPILTRAALQEQFPRLQARVLPAGMVKTHECQTSGTSGIPVDIWQTNQVNLWWFACFLRDLEWARIDPRGSLAAIRMIHSAKENRGPASEGVKQPCWIDALDPLLETGPLYCMDVLQHPRRQLQWLLEIQPDYLLSSVATATFLAGLLLEGGQRVPKLRAVQVFSETLTEEAEKRIGAGFGVPVTNTYSCTEAGYLASPCPQGHGLHVHGENVLLEVLDDRDRPCGPGETGRVVLTTLQNYLTPLVRYDIQDTATVGAAACPCGRGLPLLSRVHGRSHPVFRLPDGQARPSRVVSTRVQKLDLCHQYQIVQRGLDHFMVRLVPNRNWTDASADRVVDAVRECLDQPVRIEVVLQDRVEMTARGKLRDVLIEMASEGG